MDKWDNKTIQIQWLTGVDKWLNVHANAPRSVFKLKRNDEMPGNGHCGSPRYELSFDDEQMNEFWRGMFLIEVQGTVDTPVVSGLPEWKNGGAAQKQQWDTVLVDISDKLRLLDAKYTRLQGYMPVVDDGFPAVDRVRMMYLDKAITCDDGTTMDLVIVVLAYAESSATHEDGAGSGPPH